jgi:hypothetical protein
VKPWKAALVGVKKWIIDRFSSVFQAL